MAKFCPSLITVDDAGTLPRALGGLVTLVATWEMSSGERYGVTVPWLPVFVCASLVELLRLGMLGPLDLLALSQPE